MMIPKTNDPPSFWEVVSDFSKNVITLTSVLLGLTVTFASGLIGKVPTDESIRLALYATWLLAILTIAFGIAAQGFIARYLKTGHAGGMVALCANLAFALLLLSAIAFTVFGVLVVQLPKTTDAPAISEKAISSMPAAAAGEESRWELKRLTLDPTKGGDGLVLIIGNSSQTYTLSFDTKGKMNQIETRKPSCLAGPLSTTFNKGCH